jgi:hypothetical protein
MMKVRAAPSTAVPQDAVDQHPLERRLIEIHPDRGKGHAECGRGRHPVRAEAVQQPHQQGALVQAIRADAHPARHRLATLGADVPLPAPAGPRDPLRVPLLLVDVLFALLAGRLGFPNGRGQPLLDRADSPLHGIIARVGVPEQRDRRMGGLRLEEGVADEFPLVQPQPGLERHFGERVRRDAVRAKDGQAAVGEDQPGGREHPWQRHIRLGGDLHLLTGSQRPRHLLPSFLREVDRVLLFLRLVGDLSFWSVRHLALLRLRAPGN